MQTKLKKPAPTKDAMPAESLTELFPKGSSLDDIVRVTRANTDLPATAALFSAYSYISTALAQAGFTINNGSGYLASPNLPVVVAVSDDTSPECIFRDVVGPVFREPAIVELQPTMTAASLFGHGASVSIEVPMDSAAGTELRCVSLIRSTEAQDWLKALHSETSLGKLRRHLCGAFAGGRLHRWTTDGDEYSAAMHLSALLTCRQSGFFAVLGGLFFSSPLVQQFLLVLAHDRPIERKPLYAADGVSAASAAWRSAWQRMLAGPRCYSATPDARNSYSAWWLARLSVQRDAERDLRQIGDAVWKYALVVQALMDPIGKVSEDAIAYALRIADRHLADLATANRKLASETEAERLARKVADYIVANPDTTRGAIMRNVRGASDPAALNASLTRIAEMHPDSDVRARALELRSASRSRHERPNSTGGGPD